MPSGAADQRAEEMAALDGVLHARRTDARIGEWLVAVGELEGEDARQVELIKRDFDRTQKVPADLSATIARTTAKAHRIWADARGNDDFNAFAPALTEVLSLMREKASALADGGELYDALLQGYEPGATGAEIDNVRRASSAFGCFARESAGV